MEYNYYLEDWNQPKKPLASKSTKTRLEDYKKYLLKQLEVVNKQLENIENVKRQRRVSRENRARVQTEQEGVQSENDYPHDRTTPDSTH